MSVIKNLYKSIRDLISPAKTSNSVENNLRDFITHMHDI